MRGSQRAQTAAAAAAANAANEKALIEQMTQAASRSGMGPPHVLNIDPAITGPLSQVQMLSAQQAQAVTAEGSDGGDVKKGAKRELSTSKRAAQNRAAQRAFRQRKETHIKKLEEQVRDYNLLLEHYKRVQAENMSLRDYAITLQSRLVEVQGEIPQPPLNVNLDAPREDGLPPGIANALALQGISADDDETMDTNDSDVAVADTAGPGPGAVAGLAQGMPAPSRAPVANAATQLQASAAQAVAKGHAGTGMQGSIEERTDPALK